MELILDGQTLTLEKGGTACMPRGIMHGYKNTAPGISRSLSGSRPPASCTSSSTSSTTCRTRWK